MALVSASGAAALKGLIIKNGESIQTSKDINYIFLDKTGTITSGKPEVIEYSINNDLFSIISALEQHSIHPLAKSIYIFAQKKILNKKISFDTVSETAGEGISGNLNNKTYFAGKPSSSAPYSELLKKGYTVIEIKVDNQIKGFIALSDIIKPDSYEAIKKFKKIGIIPVMVTGDNEITAKFVAESVGITEIKSKVKPDEKVKFIREYQINKFKVAMVGDGINDAAALKTADIGIAVGTGADIAIDSADIIIRNGELTKVVDAITISRLTFKKIKQNLFWSLFYNAAAIPLAAAGIIHPIIAETAMCLSSINVILNSIQKKYNYKK